MSLLRESREADEAAAFARRAIAAARPRQQQVANERILRRQRLRYTKFLIAGYAFGACSLAVLYLVGRAPPAAPGAIAVSPSGAHGAVQPGAEHTDSPIQLRPAAQLQRSINPTATSP